MTLFDCIRCGLQLNEDTFQHTGCCGKVICRACVESLLINSTEGIFERIFDCQNCIFEVKNNKLRKNMYLGMLIESVQQSKLVNNLQATKTLDTSSDLSQTDIQTQKFQVKINCGRCNSENIKTICVCETCSKNTFSKEKNNQSTSRLLFQDYSQLSNVNQSQYLCESCCDIIHSVGDYLKHSIQRIPSSYFQQQVVNKLKLFELKHNSSTNNSNNDSIFNSSNVSLSNESGKAAIKSNKCKIHINENYKKICSKDYEILCDSCSHKHLNTCSGNIINVDIAHRDFIHNLFLNVENLQLQKNMLRNEADTLQHVVGQLNQVKQNAKKHIQSQIQDLIMLLKAKEDQILRQVENNISQKQLQVQDYMKEVLNKIEQQTNLSNLMYAAINSEEYYKFDLLGSLPFFINKYKETLSFDTKKSINNFTQLSDMYITSPNLQGQISPVEITQFEEAKLLFLSLSLKGLKDEQTLPSKSNLNLFQAINSNQINQNYIKQDFSRKNNLKSPHSNSQSNIFGKNSSQNSNDSSQNASQKEIEITDVEKQQNPIQNTIGQISSSSSLAQMISNSSLSQLSNNTQVASGAHLSQNNNRLNTPKQTTRKTSTVTSQTNKSNGSFSNLNVNPLTNSIDFNSIVSAKCGGTSYNNSNQSIISSTIESEKGKHSAKKAVSSNIGNFGISQVSSFCENIGTPAATLSGGVGINDQLSTKNQRSNITNSQSLQQKLSPTDSNYQSTNSNKPSKVPDRTNKNIPSSTQSTVSSAREHQNSTQRESSRSRVQQQSSSLQNQQNTPVKRSPSMTKKSLEPTNSNRQSASRSCYQSSANGGKQVAKSLHDITDMLSNHDLIQYSELAKNPLAKRVITKTYSTCSSIMLQWTHSAYYQGDIKYAVEFGIGMKIGGKELFKQVYLGSFPQYIIEGLQPKTTYKVRVCAVQTKKKEANQIEGMKDLQKNESTQVMGKSDNNLQEEEKISGEWSEVQSVCTQEVQTIEPSECAQIIRKEKEIIVQYDTPGIVTTLYPYYYGKICWDITASVASHACGEDTTACLIVGVTNKQNKKFSIVGSTINYGLHRETLKIKVELDFNKNIMIIYTPGQPLGEVYNSLPLGGLYPAFQNKTSQKTTLSNLKLKIAFEQQ